MIPLFTVDIAQVDAARQRLSAVQDDLARIRVRASALAHQTDWQSSGAQAFRDAVAAWHTDLALVDWPIDRLRDSLLRTRGMLESLEATDR